ncbi:hypothetical protein [Actinomadura sp. SCN-SB]|uniref:hypothetical protein n=1 Tax=Actinomadura sp. SCN-SB TaxID=3373092 RepID=UPI003751AF02
MMAAGAIAIAVALLAVGGYALWRAVDTAADPVSAGIAPQSSESRPASPTAVPVLALAVTGTRTRVYVAKPGDGEILVSRVMARGETFVSDERRLAVVVEDGSAVRIRVNGKARPPAEPGVRVAFTVDGDRTASGA